MDKAEIEKRFRENVLEIVQRRGLPEAALSVKAGLNRRFITDLREGKMRSPTMSNAYKLAEALDMDLRDIIAGRNRPAVNIALLNLLQEYSPEEQARVLQAVLVLLPRPSEG